MRETLYFIAEGYRLRISNMLDCDGDLTSDPDEAVSIVARLPDGRWLAHDCLPGEIVSDHRLLH